MPAAPALKATPGTGKLALTFDRPGRSGSAGHRLPRHAHPRGRHRRGGQGRPGHDHVVHVQRSGRRQVHRHGRRRQPQRHRHRHRHPGHLDRDLTVKSASTTKASAAATAYGKAPKGVVPSGKVTVKEGSSTLGTGTLNSSGKVTVGLSNHLKVATHKLTVSYAGDSKLNTSSATVSLKVTKAAPSVAVTRPASVNHTARAEVTVKVAATGTTPAGTVRVYEGSKVIATGTLKSGKVTITLPKLSRGKHTLRAFYVGSSTVNAKNSANFTIKST
ncbi:Ig-like domain-containing protein [Streptomyces sp. NPDC014889]|uniref:Ig-like domain-containing protein n=1 Tax=Streptomyces sp. NPDC014889 TaxID=3364928 RepID=UPI0036F81D81